ncbi:MAG: hypothetical protein QOE97_2357 [Pseudonocardiales bacterium]|jgi:hypothetical protein|nr:hypothetical protein [Pseudonocardiales bacterium]
MLPALNGLFEPQQACRPQLGEKRFQGAQTLGSHEVEAPLTLGANLHEPCLAEDLEVLGYGLLSDVKMLGYLPDGAGLVPDQQEHRSAPRFG